MTAYIIAEIEVTDEPAYYERYRPAVGAAIRKYGGRYLAAGGAVEALEGAPAKRMVMLEFPDLAAARRWYDSPENGEAKAIRHAAATSRVLMVEGVP
jgi:uncharacterized protein (DUF1330 family)